MGRISPTAFGWHPTNHDQTSKRWLFAKIVKSHIPKNMAKIAYLGLILGFSKAKIRNFGAGGSLPFHDTNRMFYIEFDISETKLLEVIWSWMQIPGQLDSFLVRQSNLNLWGATMPRALVGKTGVIQLRIELFVEGWAMCNGKSGRGVIRDSCWSDVCLSHQLCSLCWTHQITNLPTERPPNHWIDDPMWSNQPFDQSTLRLSIDFTNRFLSYSSFSIVRLRSLLTSYLIKRRNK